VGYPGQGKHGVKKSWKRHVTRGTDSSTKESVARRKGRGDSSVDKIKSKRGWREGGTETKELKVGIGREGTKYVYKQKQIIGSPYGGGKSFFKKP